MMTAGRIGNGWKPFMTETHAFEGAQRCPRCGLFNPAGAILCDCGYNFRNGHVEAERVEPAAPEGVGGWLALLTLGLLALGPLTGVGRTYADFMSAESNFPALTVSDEWLNLKVATWLVVLCTAVISVYAGWGLAHGRTWSVVRRAQVALWIIGPLAVVVQILAVPLVVLGSTSALDGSIEESFAGPFVMSVIYAFVWWAYLGISKRVRATYAETANAQSGTG
jgi:hypothetical protein